MQQFISWIGKTAMHGVIFWLFALLAISGVTYALTYNWSDPTSIRNRTAGNPLTSSGWNILVGNMDNLNERVTNIEWTGAIKSVVTVYGPSVCGNNSSVVNCPAGTFLMGGSVVVTSSPYSPIYSWINGTNGWVAVGPTGTNSLTCYVVMARCAN